MFRGVLIYLRVMTTVTKHATRSGRHRATDPTQADMPQSGIGTITARCTPRRIVRLLAWDLALLCLGLSYFYTLSQSEIISQICEDSVWEEDCKDTALREEVRGEKEAAEGGSI